MLIASVLVLPSKSISELPPEASAAVIGLELRSCVTLGEVILVLSGLGTLPW
jgi:hypothetical protein